MNILILTGKFGYGHNSAALSIKEKLEIENPNCNITIVDFMDYMFPKISKVIYKAFAFLVNRCSGVYNILNHIASKKSNVPLKKVIVKRIDNLLFDNNTDLIISVLPICSQYINAYKKITKNKIKLYTVITDIYVHNEWIAEETDKYFVPALETKIELINKNVDKDKIVISGIPVKESFNKQEKIINNKKKLLIMGGGLGLIPQIDSFLKELDRNNNISVTVITGSNTKLYNKINKKFDNIKVLGFTNEVAKYMNEADLIITKAGGITLFESINSLTPMFVIKPFLMQEIGNANYIIDHNIGEVIWENKDNAYNKIISLVNNQERLEEMHTNMKQIKNTFLKTDINKELIEMVEC